MAGHAPRPHCLWTTVADGYTIEVDTNGERDKARLIGMGTPGTPEASVCRELPALSGVLGPAARADGVRFHQSGFRIRTPPYTPLSP